MSVRKAPQATVNPQPASMAPTGWWGHGASMREHEVTGDHNYEKCSDGEEKGAVTKNGYFKLDAQGGSSEKGWGLRRWRKCGPERGLSRQPDSLLSCSLAGDPIPPPPPNTHSAFTKCQPLSYVIPTQSCNTIHINSFNLQNI